jgi:hypothetical protein
VGFFTKFFGRTASEGAAFALGVAVGPVLQPAVRELENQAWSTYTTRPLTPGDAAEIVAEDVALQPWGENEASLTGVDAERFDKLMEATRNAPDLASAFEMWRRNLIMDADFEHALRKARLEPRWIEPLKALQQRLLSPQDLANARQQGFIDVARQHSESALQGVDNERADLLYEMSGLPPGVETGLEMLRRSIINDATFAQIVREGHTKTKYTDELLQLRHPVLSASIATTLRIKGWIDQAAQHALGALSGFTPEQMDQMYLAAGRPAAPGQMWTAAARGVDGPDGVPMNEAQFLKGIRESDIRPEWGPMLWEIRYLYPSLFQLTRLVTSGAIDPATGAEWAHKARYAPEVVTALRASWQKASTSGASSYLNKADLQLWGTTHRTFVARETNVTQARASMRMIGISTAEQTEILARWTAEQALIRKQLTAAQIKKAYAKVVKNEATGQPWTLDDAISALVNQGYSVEGATQYLDIPPTR